MTNKSRVIASLINFESAYFAETVESDKPENCINNIKECEIKYATIKQLLDGILEINNTTLPNGAICWNELADLEDSIPTITLK